MPCWSTPLSTSPITFHTSFRSSQRLTMKLTVRASWKYYAVLLQGSDWLKLNEKFWEELIAYCPLIRNGPHRKQKKIGEGTDTQTARRSHQPHWYGTNHVGKEKITRRDTHRQQGDLISLTDTAQTT
jgi:hypothetical protein